MTGEAWQRRRERRDVGRTWWMGWGIGLGSGMAWFAAMPWQFVGIGVLLVTGALAWLWVAQERREIQERAERLLGDRWGQWARRPSLAPLEEEHDR